jgi:alpha-tubulin suppressor-like RCC1 family protein
MLHLSKEGKLTICDEQGIRELDESNEEYSCQIFEAVVHQYFFGQCNMPLFNGTEYGMLSKTEYMKSNVKVVHDTRTIIFITDEQDVYLHGDYCDKFGLADIYGDKIVKIPDIKAVDAVIGKDYVVYLTEFGDVYMSGNLTRFSFMKESSYLPVKIPNFSAKSAYCNDYMLVFLTDDNDAYVYSEVNIAGLCHSETLTKLHEKYIWISIYDDSCIFITDEYSVYIYGNSNYSKLGNKKYYHGFVKKPNFKASKAYIGEYYTMFITENQELYTCGEVIDSEDKLAKLPIENCVHVFITGRVSYIVDENNDVYIYIDDEINKIDGYTYYSLSSCNNPKSARKI